MIGHDSRHARQLRDAFGSFATGVAVVIARNAANDATAVTINSLSSLSLDPALVAFSIAHRSRCLPRLLAADQLAISVLRHDQRSLAANFARPSSVRWQEIPLTITSSGNQVIGDALAALECVREQEIAAGDHLMFVLRVTSVHIGAPADPLVFFRSKFGSFVPEQPESSAAERWVRERDSLALSLTWG